MTMSSPVWKELPLDLVLLAFVEAARAALEWEASWITQLSLVSQATYNAVTPILYETLVITDDNLKLMARLGEEERLMKYVRKVCTSATRNPRSTVVRALSRDTIHTFDATISGQLTTPFRPRLLYLHNSTLWELRGTGQSKVPLASVTHLSVAYQHRTIPYTCVSGGRPRRRRRPLLVMVNHLEDSSDSDDPTGESGRRDPLYRALDALPALTHLSLDVGRQRTPLPGEGLRVLIIKILEACPRLLVFALHVMGHWDLVASLVAPVHDSRIRVWFDRRVPASAGEELALRVRDARMGYNVWTQAEPLYHDLG